MAANMILVADDDCNVIELLDLYFNKEGFQGVYASSGKEAIEKFYESNPDLIILDIMMPELDGLEVCRQIRSSSRVPIIMLTAKDEDLDKILGLEMGADDYITKPFNPREVIARIKAVLRRTNEPAVVQSRTLRFPMLEINLTEFEVKVKGKSIACTPKEIELLWTLASQPGRVYSREEHLEKVWGYEYFGDTRTVDTHIKRLRQKLAISPEDPWDIKTVWGVGYKFEVTKT